MCHLIPFKSIPSAIETTDAFMSVIYRFHGLPSEIITDRGTQFTSKYWKAVCSSLNVSLKFSSPHHHQSNGQVERINSVIEQYFRCFVNYQGTNWFNFLHLAEFSYNNSINESTKNTPFLNYRFHPHHSTAVPSDIDVPRAKVFSDDFNKIMDELKQNLKEFLCIQKRYADQHRQKPSKFKVNDKVYVNYDLFNRGGNKKLKPRKLGPFIIKKIYSNDTYKIKLPKSIRIHPIIHVSNLEPYIDDEFGRQEEPPPPIIINNEEEYEVEEILDMRTHYGKKQYLIKWKGYSIDESSWEPEENLNYDELLKEFLKNSRKH